MNIDLIIVVLTIVTNLGLGAIVFYRDPRKLINRIFAGMTIAVGLWSFANFLADNSKIPYTALLSTKLTFVAAIWIGYFLSEFGIHFPDRFPKIPKWFSIVIIFPPIVLSGISLTNNVVKGIEFKEYGVNVLLGPCYLLFMIFFLLYFLAGLLFLAMQHRNAKNLEKSQLNFVFAGLFLAGSLASMTNLVIPFITKSAEFSKLGPLFTVFFVAFTAYAITKHALFDIRVIATELLVVLLGLVLLVQALLNPTNIVNWALLFLAIYLGYLLIKSVLKEISQRQELEIAHEKLKELDKLKDEFLAMATHELNTPIAAIKGKLSMALEENLIKLDTKQKAFFWPILISLRRLTALIADLLDVSRIEGGRLHIAPKPFALEELIESVILEFQERAKEKNLNLIFQKPKEPLPQVFADPDKTRQILNNLVSNGIKFTEKGEVRIKAERKDSEILVSVKDTGIGIDKKDIPRLFGKFQQINREQYEQQGSGLGLYIAKSLTEPQRGKIWAESKGIGEGSIFYFTLPIAKKSIMEMEKNEQSTPPISKQGQN